MQLTFVHKITRVFNVILMLRASFPIEVYAGFRFAARHSRHALENLALYFSHFIVDILSFIVALEEDLNLCILHLRTFAL